MTIGDVLALLERNRNDRGVAHWERLYPTSKLRSFGIGLTQLRKLAKQVGRDHELAGQLWASDVYDAKVIALLIDDPKAMTRVQAEAQVEGAGSYMLSHVYCSCDAPLAKAPFARDLAVAWAAAKDHGRRRCGYLLLYELAKGRKDPALTDAFFTDYLDRIGNTIGKEENLVKDAMNAAVLAIGKRNPALRQKAMVVARAYAPLRVDYGDNACEVMDVVKHLTGAMNRRAS
jgi:3-methyladenine DNA glycosylase AlkD